MNTPWLVRVIVGNMTKIERWALAIMEFEGWSKGSVSYRNNNPGNLKWPRTRKDEYGHTIFTTFHQGWDRLVYQLEMATDGRSGVYYPEMDFYQFFEKYAEANSKEYAEFVAKRLEISPMTKIKHLK